MLKEVTTSLDFAAVDRVVYGIGAQKAGTTWLYETLREHPEVHLCERKEVHYWDSIRPPHLPYYKEIGRKHWERVVRASLARRLARTVRYGRGETKRARRQAERYYRMIHQPDPAHGHYQAYVMEGWSGERLAGEISPGYAMMDSEGFAEMDAVAPDARFVFIMRDPVARLWSNRRHNRSRGFLSEDVADDLNKAFRQALDDPGCGAFRMTDYAWTLEQLEAAVPEAKIGYFFYETLFRPEEMERLRLFLGVAPIKADFSRQVNRGSEAPADLDPELAALARERLAHVYEAVAQRFGSQVPDAWRAQ